MLRSYPTTLDQDQRLMADAEEVKKMSGNKINCVRLRVEEKKILGHVVKYCQGKATPPTTEEAPKE